MPTNANIIMGVQAPQLEQPVNQMAKVLQLRGAMDDRAMRQMEMQQVQKKLAEEQAIGEAYRNAVGADGSVDRNKFVNILATGGMGSRIPGVQKQWADADKATADVGKVKADTEKTQLEAAHKRVDSWGQAMGFVRQNPTPENAQAAVQHLVTMGIMPPEKARQAIASLQADPTPQGIARFAEMGFRAALSAKEQLPTFQTRNLGGTTDTLSIDPVTQQVRTVNQAQNTQSPDNAASNARMAADAAAARAVQIRGQNLSDARAREATSATMSRPFEVTGPDGVPVLVQQDKQGNIRPVQGYAPKSGGKPMTEGQAKANLFGSRMRESDRILSQLEGKYSPLAVNAKMGAEKMPGVGGIAGAVGNAMLSNEGQMAEQAQRDFVNAVLRRESGAVISDQEFANAQKQYFPQPNDSQAVLAQKRRNRQMAIQGLEAEVPGGLKMGGKPAPAPGGASGGWSIQRVK
jgi:hypothetical protein